jgi:hypothetical protein
VCEWARCVVCVWACRGMGWAGCARVGVLAGLCIVCCARRAVCAGPCFVLCVEARGVVVRCGKWRVRGTFFFVGRLVGGTANWLAWLVCVRGLWVGRWWAGGVGSHTL